ncbi:MAG: type II toxin-antitoxin system RelE/ParE family toxin [Dehalococcoidia bacterium]
MMQPETGDRKVYLYETPTGSAVVLESLRTLERSSPAAFAAIRTGIGMLETFGPDPGLNRFKRLRHVPGGRELWELRVQSKPAFRVLFAPIPGTRDLILLHVVAKAEMEKGPQRQINLALDRLDSWLDVLRGSD